MPVCDIIYEVRMNRIGIIGCGTWGVALASVLDSNNHLVTVWSQTKEKADNLTSTHTHPNLPGVSFSDSIVFTSDLKNTIENNDVVLCALPSFAVRSVFSKASRYITPGQIIISATKGIESSTLFTMTEIISDELCKQGKKNTVVAISGPTHAEEVVKQLPTTIVAGCENLTAARFVKRLFNNSFFKVFGTTDRKGVELCGALKNIIAIAAGISDGLGYGDNAKAALITRGMAEISFLGEKLGCHEHTFFGLAGIGDMIVTSTSQHSRNNRCGYLIGKGKTPEEAVKEINMVVEGINVLPSAIEMSKKYNINLPIISSVNEIIANGKEPKDVQASLLSMPATREFRILGRYKD